LKQDFSLYQPSAVAPGLHIPLENPSKKWLNELRINKGPYITRERKMAHLKWLTAQDGLDSSLFLAVPKRGKPVELKQDGRPEEAIRKPQYVWIEYIPNKELHEIRVRVKQRGTVLEAINRGREFILDRSD
jgi:hypothetical protein